MLNLFNYLIIVLFLLQFLILLAYSNSNLIENNLINNNKSLILCKDGKGPLLEGEGYIFKCFENNCPNGFQCEYLLNNKNGEGICCPNLTELFKLYNEASIEIKGESNEKIIKEREEEKLNEKNQSEAFVNAMELLEKHYGKIIVREKPKQLNNLNISLKTISSSSSSSSSSFASSIPLIISPNNFFQKNNFSSVRDSPVILNENNKKQQQIIEANIWKPKIFFSKKINIDSSGEEFSCKKQKLEPFCENGNKKTQFVIRWYAKEGICYSYPWGYCPGEPIATDKTIRTFKECEELCTDKKLNKNYPKIKNPIQISGIVRLTENEEIEEEEIKENNNNNKEGEEIIKEKELINEISTIPENERKIIVNNSSSLIYSSLNNQIKIIPPPSSASAELAEFLLLEQKTFPKIKKCEKITPYRTKCNLNGLLPSQFTLRWYQRGNNCFAYPYGYCQEENEEEEPIKTEKECLSICVKKNREVNELMKRRRF